MSVDALSLLREYVTEKKNVELVEGKLIMGEHSFPKKMATVYRSEMGKGEPYLLEAIWFYCVNASMSFGVYARACVKARVKAIRVDDQKELLKYMSGLAETSPCLDFTLISQPDDAGAVEQVQDAQIAELKDSGQWTVDDIYLQEKPLSTRISMLQTDKPKDLISAGAIFDRVVRDRKHKKDNTANPQQNPAMRLAPTPTLPTPAKRPRTNDPTASMPIIIVPQAVTSIINMYNAQDLLDKGIFVDPNVKRQQMGAKPPKIFFDHASFTDASKNCKYMVIDNIALLTKDDWKRVVAVFVSGAEWQFKGWPWNSIASIFDHVCAFHLHYDDELLNPKIATWRCQRLTVSKIKRYKDRSMILDMWTHLLDFVAARDTEGLLSF